MVNVENVIKIIVDVNIILCLYLLLIILNMILLIGFNKNVMVNVVKVNICWMFIFFIGEKKFVLMYVVVYV